MTIHRLLRTDVSFDPDAVQAMCSAFEAVCEELELSNNKSDRLTEVVALKIIEVARTGERNVVVLRDSGLRLLGVIRQIGRAHV